MVFKVIEGFAASSACADAVHGHGQLGPSVGPRPPPVQSDLAPLAPVGPRHRLPALPEDPTVGPGAGRNHKQRRVLWVVERLSPDQRGDENLTTAVAVEVRPEDELRLLRALPGARQTARPADFACGPVQELDSIIPKRRLA